MVLFFYIEIFCEISNWEVFDDLLCKLRSWFFPAFWGHLAIIVFNMI